jgi:hypothetical protein
LSRIIGFKRKWEVKFGKIKLHSHEIYNAFLSLNISRITNSKDLRLRGNLQSMGMKRNV